MSDIVAFIRARLDEDEQIAQAALDPKHRGEWVWRKDSRTTVRNVDGAPIEPAAPGIERGPHIARWHPKRVLDDIAAKRQMLDETLPVLQWADDVSWGEYSSEQDAKGDFLKLLALPYAAHPDFDPAWRP